MDPGDIEGEAADIRARAGFDGDDVPSIVAVARALGVVVRRVDRAVLRGDDARVMTCGGRREILIRAGLEPTRMQWAIGHELAEMRLQDLDYREPDVEVCADAIAAAILMPRIAYRDAVREHGLRIADLARDFVVDQTAAALRIAEIHVVDAVVVVTPQRVYARGEDAFELPSEADIRRGLMRALGADVVALGDAPRRTAYIARG